MLRRVLPFVVPLGIGALGFAALVACNSADFTPAPTIDCSKTQCTCEQDPSQPTCKGYSGQPEGGTPDLDAGPALDAASDAATDAGDDGATDAGEDADAS